MYINIYIYNTMLQGYILSQAQGRMMSHMFNNEYREQSVENIKQLFLVTVLATGHELKRLRGVLTFYASRVLKNRLYVIVYLHY